MFKDWQPPDRLPDGVIYWTDSCFQGLRTDYPQCSVIQPQKKPRGKKINALDQWCNALRASIRIVVEHAIGGVKRFGAIAQTYRNRGAEFEDRLTQTIARCYGDGAYDRWKVHRVLAYPGQGDGPIDAVIPPQRNASVRKSKRHYRHIQARNERVETIEQQGRKRWKQHTGYHRRSLAETGIARYKRIIGPKLRARVFLRQQVEARLGCKRLNRMTQLGMPQAYKVEVGG
jgi:hypothetical protein